jgi:hypothetical protein
MMTSTLLVEWQAAIERHIAEQVAQLGRRRPELGPEHLSDVHECLLRIARELFLGTAARVEPAARTAAVLGALLRADEPARVSSRVR